MSDFWLRFALSCIRGAEWRFRGSATSDTKCVALGINPVIETLRGICGPFYNLFLDMDLLG